MTDPFGPRLKRARRKRHVSQEQLAELANMDRGHISKIESGKIYQPTEEVITRLASALQMTDEELIVEFRHVQEGESRYREVPTREEVLQLFHDANLTPSRLAALREILSDWVD